jgi:NADH-quinone oxidoreductase chain G
MMPDNNENITFSMNGQELTVPKGTTVLEAAKLNGINIPTFCWHPKLKPAGACRICYVEIEKMPKLMVSCATEATPGMIVHTETEQVKQGRKAVLEFTLANHPLDCPTCDKGGECDLQDLTFAHGIDESRFDFKKYRHIRDKNMTFDDLRIGPEIIRNQNRCILCYKCVRSNKEIFGEYDLGAFQRGNITEINAAPGEEVDSLYSGNLVEICPVGALTNTDWRYKIRVWKTETVNSISPFHSDGANITLWKNRRTIFRTTSRRNDEIDEGWLDNVSRYGYQIATSDARLTTPLVKKGDSQVPVTWEEALELVARKFKDIKDKKGGVCIGGIMSPSLDCTSLYTFSKFFRTVLNSNNVDFRTEYKMLPEEADDLYSRMSLMPFKIADIEKSDLILVIASDMQNEHPITDLRIRKAVTKLGASLYVLNPVNTKSGSIATDEMIYRPGTLDALLNGIAVGIIESGNINSSVDIGKLKSMIEPKTVADVSAICGIDADRIMALAEAVGKAQNVSIISGEFLTMSIARDRLAGAIHNLCLVANLYGKGQIGLLPRAANSRGAEKLGVLPHLSTETKDRLSQMWGFYPDVDGLASDKMILSSIKEELDSLFIIGSNPMLGYPDGQFVKEGLEKLDFLVVADLYETETSQIADVVLPMASWAEYDGKFINLEGTAQDFDTAMNPVGHALPAYEIINRISQFLKSPLYESLEEHRSQMDSLLSKTPSIDPTEELAEVKHGEDKINPEYPYPLFVVDELHHFGHWTEKSKSLTAFCGEAFLEISPSMAEKLEIKDGSLVRIESEVGKINIPARISEYNDSEVLIAYRNFSTGPSNLLQMRKRDIDRVKISKVDGS